MTKNRKARNTLLLVGEGEAEKAFLTHLRDIYVPQDRVENPRVTVKAAYGGSPKDVLIKAADYAEQAHYNSKILLFDTDINWPNNIRKMAKGFTVFGSSPCLEGLLLSILNKTPPSNSDDCKAEMKKILEGNLTNSSSYSKGFSKDVLDLARTKKNVQLKDSRQPQPVSLDKFLRLLEIR